MTIPSPSDFGEIFFAGSLAPSCGHLRAAATCFGSDEALPVLSCIQLGLAVSFSCCAALRCAALSSVNQSRVCVHQSRHTGAAYRGHDSLATTGTTRIGAASVAAEAAAAIAPPAWSSAMVSSESMSCFGTVCSSAPSSVSCRVKKNMISESARNAPSTPPTHTCSVFLAVVPNMYWQIIVAHDEKDRF